jgi:hypothetical protein
MNARDYLNEARATIQDRGLDYGHPSDNMARTAALWSSYLEMPVTDYQVAICMALVKIARSMETGKTDTYVDMAAYVAIAGQLHTEENELYISTKDDQRKEFIKFAKQRGFQIDGEDN